MVAGGVAMAMGGGVRGAGERGGGDGEGGGGFGLCGGVWEWDTVVWVGFCDGGVAGCGVWRGGDAAFVFQNSRRKGNFFIRCVR